jgi:flagellar L-ring protein FlgH
MKAFNIRLGLVLAAALALCVLVPRWALADSLYTQPESNDPNAAGLYAPHPVPLEVGDIVKVRVREKSVADVQLGVSTKDQAKNSLTLDRQGGVFGRLLNPLLKLIGEGTVGYDSKHDFKDDGSTDRTVRMDGIVTALVTEKLDNGQLIIEGRKQVLINSENQTMVVRGVIDPRDLDMDRMIDSDLIADVEIQYLGEGQLTKRTKPNFLSRVLDAIF